MVPLSVKYIQALEEKKRNKRELKWEANQLYGAIKSKIHPGFGYVKI